MTRDRMAELTRTAAQAMLSPDGECVKQVAAELPQLFALVEDPAAASDVDVPDAWANGRTPDCLRTDTAALPDEGRTLIRLSKNEQKGFVRVVRTVG